MLPPFLFDLSRISSILEHAGDLKIVEISPAASLFSVGVLGSPTFESDAANKIHEKNLYN